MSYPFGKDAESYWQRGLSPIPVEPGTKQPARGLRHWTSYGNNLPKTETRAEWLTKYSRCNIGLCTGTEFQAGYRIGAVDIDDERFVNVTTAIIGSDVSSKAGKKGKTLFVRIPRAAQIRSTALFTSESSSAIDFLYTGKMTVLPPSIHPETKLPYRWASSSLLEIDLATLPVFDETKLGLLKRVVASPHSLALTAGVSTHEAGLRFAAELVTFGCEDALIFEVFKSLLPSNYSGNSMQELPEWIGSARRKGFGEPNRQAQKRSAADKLIDLFEQSGATLFHDEGRRSDLPPKKWTGLGCF